MYVQALRVRFDDVDYAQIVYFPRLFGYCHWVFEDFFAKECGIAYSDLLIKKRIGFPTVHSEADFKHPLRFGDLCRVEMETLKLGSSSLTNRYRLYLGETKKLCADVQIVHVAMHMDKFKAVNIPEPIREAFLNHLHGYHSA
jgi:4-hydroxybenzoyl-CoA thioesterase